MKSIQEDIKNGTYKQVYLLCGEENYLKQQYKQRLLQGLLPEDDTMNKGMFEGKGINPREVIDLGETMPFFAERRVILIQDSGFFKNKCDELADYMEQLPDYLTMVFVEDEVDKRSRMYKAVKKVGRIGEFTTQSENTLMKWVMSRLKQEGKKITQKDMELFLTMTGTDMGNISSELEKLLSYTMGRDVITTEDIHQVCVPQIDNKIFDMVRAVTERRQEKALELYYDLLALKEPPMRILFLLARQFNQLLQVKESVSQGYGNNEISKKLGIPSFAVRNSINCARAYSSEELRQAVEDCLRSEEDVKTGRLGDVLSVELLIIKYSSKKNNNE